MRSLCPLLLLLVLGAAGTLGTPAGFTTFFDAASCPDGWYPLSTAEGNGAAY